MIDPRGVPLFVRMEIEATGTPSLPSAEFAEGCVAPAAALRDGLSRISITPTAAEREALRTLVRSYVDEVHSLGWPPERILATVKQIAREAGLVEWADRRVIVAPVTDTGRLLDQMITWCVTQYYEHSMTA